MPVDINEQLIQLARALDDGSPRLTLNDIARSDRSGLDTAHFVDVEVTRSTRPDRRWHRRLAVAAGLVVLLAGLAAVNTWRASVDTADDTHSSTPPDTHPPLVPAEEIALAVTDIDATIGPFHWSHEYDLTGVRPISTGTLSEAGLAQVAHAEGTSVDDATRRTATWLCSGRGANGGCGDPGEVAHLVDSRGIPDTIVWRGLPDIATVVVLRHDSLTLWQRPLHGVAAFPVNWCTADSCPYELSAYGADGQRIAIPQALTATVPPPTG